MKIKLMYAGAVISMVFGLGGMIIGFALLSFFIGFTSMASFVFGVTKFISLDKRKKIKTKNDELFVAWLVFYCTAIISFLHFSFAIVDTFFHPDIIKYNFLMIIYFSVMAFVNIVVGAINGILAIRNKNLIIHHLTFIDLANSIIGLSLAQRAILYYVDFPHARLVSCIGGIFFSILAGLVCLIMYRKQVKQSYISAKKGG